MVIILRFVHVHDYKYYIVATDTLSLLVVGSVVVVRVQLSWIHDSKRVYRSLDRLHQTYCTRTEFLDQEFLLPYPNSVFACTSSIERERTFDHAVYETAYSVELLVRLEH